MTETETVTGLAAKKVTYTYNTDRTLNTLTYPDGTVLTYGYNNRNQITTIKQGSSAVVTYTYDAAGNRVNKNLANGVNSTLAYDAVERLTTITDLTPVPTASTLLQSFNYGYDGMSRRMYVQRNGMLGDAYTYDTSDQLVYVQYNATNPATSPANPSRTVGYTLDGSGNRTQVTDSVNGTTQYTPNSDNQYTAVGGISLAYDQKGNLQSNNGWNYTYDAQNHLLQASSGGYVVSFAYDPLGRCIKRVDNGSVTFLVYDTGWGLLADYTSNGTLANRYVEGASTDEVLTKTDSSNNIIYYHTDGLGSVTRLTNSTGALLEQYIYDVFGQVTIENASGNVISSSNYNNRFLFTGREYISSLGVYDYRTRFYSPSLGRFMQPDSIGHAGDGYNLNRYCGNDPVNNIDSFGQDGGMQDDGTYSVPFYTGSSAGPGQLIDDPAAGPGFYEPDGSWQSIVAADPHSTVVVNGPSTPFNSGQSAAEIAVSVTNGVTSGLFGPSGGLVGGPGSQGNAIVSGVQTGLGVVGLVPGPVGEIANGVSALVSVTQGDYVTAGVVAAGIFVPGIAILAKAGKAAEDIHHIATAKNFVSTARGGPWSPRFQAIFDKAGMSLEDEANKVALPGHFGPHPEEYHQAVFDRLNAATSGLSGPAYKGALTNELNSIKSEILTPGSALNGLTTRQ